MAPRDGPKQRPDPHLNPLKMRAIRRDSTAACEPVIITQSSFVFQLKSFLQLPTFFQAQDFADQKGTLAWTTG
jgi:hypothetical protein